MAEPVLKKGSNDPAAQDLQEALKALGYDPGPVDGIFGAKTESAVKKFQQAREIAADGVVGTGDNSQNRRQSLAAQRDRSEMVGFEPTVRITAQMPGSVGHQARWRKSERTEE